MNPIIRLACADGQAERNGTPEANSPTVRLATTIEGGGSMSPKSFEQHLSARENAPALLVSYVYLEPFLKNREKYFYRDWVMDSGAFSAHNSGTEITLQSYIDTCQKLLSEDPTLTEVFALDVIGDWQASLKNCEEMWRQGIPAIPCYHVGEPEHALLAMAAQYPKIALGGAVGYKGKDKWAEQCFARIWPKKIHGFGFGGEKSIMALPWHSVDATNWEIGPCKFGRWNSFGKMSVRGSKQNLRAEVEWYLALEQRARQKWRRQMEELATHPAPSLRLALDASAASGQRAEEALAPTVRRAAQQSSEAQIKRSGIAKEPNGLTVRLATANTNPDAYVTKYGKAMGKEKKR